MAQAQAGKALMIAGVAASLALSLLLTSCGSNSVASPDVTSPSVPAVSEPVGAAPPLAEQVAKQFDLTDLPSVQVVRKVSQDELDAVMNKCLKDRGFPGLSGDVPDDQTDAWHLAIYECAARFPVDPKYQQPFSADQLRVLYSYYRDSLAPCLRGRNFNVIPVPTQETFISTWGTSSMYTPYNSLEATLSQMSDSEREELEAACPQSAPDASMYPPG